MESRRQSYYVFHKGNKGNAVITRRNNITVTQVPVLESTLKTRRKIKDLVVRRDAFRETIDCPFRMPKAEMRL